MDDIKALEGVDMERFHSWFEEKLPPSAANNIIKMIVRHDNDYRLVYGRLMHGDWKFANNLKGIQTIAVLYGVEDAAVTAIRQHYTPKFINAEIPWTHPLDR